MNAKQRRQYKRAWLRKYPYVVEMATVRGAPQWCKDNIKPEEWEYAWSAPRGVMPRRGFRFTHSKDAMMFSLLWL